MPRKGRRHTVSLLYATSVYLLSVLLLLTLLYWFLTVNGFEEENFITGAAVVAVMAMIVGYMLSGDILAPKQEMDAKFTHLSREILHELNLPLSTIEANTTMLKKTLSDEKAQRRLSRIDAASVRLKRLYDELSYTINKEIYNIEKEAFSLPVLIGERVEVLKELGRNPFVLELSDITLFADRIGFEQMIDNLLSNAMKYSSKESPIKISMQGNELLIEDQGIGMHEGELVRIFERYYQSDQNHKGEGIGLALVKAYCDESRIAIAILSDPGRGTTVKLDLTHCIETGKHV